MFDRIRKRFCRCRDVKKVSEYSILAVGKCARCEQYWLYNLQQNHRIKIAEVEAVNLQAEWVRLENLTPGRKKFRGMG